MSPVVKFLAELLCQKVVLFVTVAVHFSEDLNASFAGGQRGFKKPGSFSAKGRIVLVWAR